MKSQAPGVKMLTTALVSRNRQHFKCVLYATAHGGLHVSNLTLSRCQDAEFTQRSSVSDGPQGSLRVMITRTPRSIYTYEIQKCSGRILESGSGARRQTLWILLMICSSSPEDRDFTQFLSFNPVFRGRG